MNDFWVGPWLHSPPEPQFTNGRRTILKKLCFGPTEAHVWFVTEDGSCWHEHQLLEGLQEGEPLLKSVPREELLRVLDNEISLCRQLNREELIPLFLKEKG